MIRIVDKAAWMMLLLVASAVPAYANNPPAPDGAFSLLLIIPVVIIASRLAREQRGKKGWKSRVLTGLVLGLAILFSMAGTELSMAAMIVVVYGLWRGIEVMRHGQGAKRFGLGAAVVMFSLLAAANYVAALVYPLVAPPEARVLSVIRSIVTAEINYAAGKKIDANHNGIPEYGTMEQLIQDGLNANYFFGADSPGGYDFAVLLSGDPVRDEKEFLVVATPRNYGKPANSALRFSLIRAFRPTRRASLRSYATDETGVIRFADLGGARAVTREAAQRWQPLDWQPLE
ncbi:MAG: hypothetical protein HY508_09585 [Acidobacteria bacterium]|nr:hypothetical protein [Acidobacteriota bacterium]